MVHARSHTPRVWCSLAVNRWCTFAVHAWCIFAVNGRCIFAVNLWCILGHKLTVYGECGIDVEVRRSGGDRRWKGCRILHTYLMSLEFDLARTCSGGPADHLRRPPCLFLSAFRSL